MVLRVCIVFACASFALSSAQSAEPSPPIWPQTFHATLFQNRSGNLAIVDLWYDWPGGRNLNLIHSQQDDQKGFNQGPLYDIEWQNGTTYYFRPMMQTCNSIEMGVGILTPDWLKGAKYLGMEIVDLYNCTVWAKANFITYYAEVGTNRPVKWTFFDGMTEHLIVYEPNTTASSSTWQLPRYCFDKESSRRSADMQEGSMPSRMSSTTRIQLQLGKERSPGASYRT